MSSETPCLVDCYIVTNVWKKERGTFETSVALRKMFIGTDLMMSNVARREAVLLGRIRGTFRKNALSLLAVYIIYCDYELKRFV